MESWLATAKPVLQRREGVRGAAQHYVIQQLKQILASDRRCNGTATDRWRLPDDDWADNDQLRRWAEAEEETNSP